MTETRIPADWHPGHIPANVMLGADTYVETSYSFLRYRSRLPAGLRVGRSTAIYKGTMFDMGPAASVTVGDYVLLHGARLIADSEIRIGDYTMISWRVVIMDSRRIAADVPSRRTQLREVPTRLDRHLEPGSSNGPVVIGNNVWVGFDVCILPNVTIGDHAVIGARSVVTDDVPAYAVVAGNPAAIVRFLDGRQQ